MKSTALFAALLIATVCQTQTAAPSTDAANPHALPDGLYTEITTQKGVIVGELYYKKTPMTVANYVGLAEGTLGPEPRQPYFDGSPYHRIVPGYVLQGGGRPRGEGRGGRLGYQFPDEFVPGLRHDGMGVLQMANGGPGTNGSQHCLMLGPAQRLNYLHTVFGRVVRGIDVLPKIEVNDTMQQVKILRIGKEAQAFKADDESFKALVANAKTNEGPHEPGPKAHFNDPDGLLPTNVPRALHFNMKLSNFEIFTGQRIVARLYAKSPDIQGISFTAFLDEIARAVGVEKTGALVAYFADRDQWYVVVRPESAASFIAGPRKADGTKDAVASDKTLADATSEFLTSTKEQAAKLIEAGGQPPNDSASAAQRIKLHVDAVLDELIFRLEPAAQQ
jgi:cyclophilin family peptidyl-prolyl cis-trans isomerase